MLCGPAAAACAVCSVLIVALQTLPLLARLLQVGRDQEAQEFLSRLDRHPQIGKMVDCTR